MSAPATKTTLASAMRRDDLGSTVTIRPPDPHNPEQLVITGELRWFTHTSDTVVLAVEEPEDGEEDGCAVEWELHPDSQVRIHPRAER